MLLKIYIHCPIHRYGDLHKKALTCLSQPSKKVSIECMLSNATCSRQKLIGTPYCKNA